VDVDAGKLNVTLVALVRIADDSASPSLRSSHQRT
jgi:hypothetical protein